jgi:hypothetical protein
VLIRGDSTQDPRTYSGAASSEEKEKDTDKASAVSYSRADLCEVTDPGPCHRFNS